MERTGFAYEVHAVIKLSKADYALLVKLSAEHYDSKCKAISAVGGFLYGWQWGFEENPYQIEVHATHRQLDTLIKITEMIAPGLYTSEEMGLHLKIKEIFFKVCDESKRLNAPV